MAGKSAMLPPLSLLLAVLSLSSVIVKFALAANAAVSAIGSIKCLDCNAKNIKAEQAFQGLRVAVKCKLADSGQFVTKGIGSVDSSGGYAVHLPSDLIGKDGELNKECFAELRTFSSNAPCHDHASKLIISKSSTKAGDMHTKLVLAAEKKLQFSSAACMSAFFWKPYPFPTYHYPPKYPYFPTPSYKPAPVYTPTIPVYKPPAQPGKHTPTYGSQVPPVHNTPAYKPTPKPTYTPPSYKPSPTYTPPTYNPTPKPTYTPPPMYKPPPAVIPQFPPFPKYPPYYSSHPSWKNFFHKPKHPIFPPVKENTMP